MTDPNAANLFRVLGTIEPGQCTIIADEAEKIDKSSELMTTLKTGYNIKGKVARTNSNTWKQEFFWTYCLKIIIAERSPNQSDARGVLDRTFILDTYKGNPQYDIKEVLNPSGDKTRQKLLDELLDFRKLMLVYRLIHFNDPIQDIDIGLDGRDKELCKPTIQLFYNTKSQSEIEAALQIHLLQKNQRKETTIEAALCPIIANAISQYGIELSVSQLWQSLKVSIDGTSDERKPNEYQTSDYGTIYKNTITNIMCDKFGAKKKHRENGTLLIFDPQKVARAGKVYNTNVSIQTKILSAENRPEDPEGSEGSMELPEDNHYKDDIDNEKDINILSKNTQAIVQNPANILKSDDNRNNGMSPKPSLPSEPSAIIIQQQSTIYRIGHSDNWACHNCKQKGDKWFMRNHMCRR